ncbi:MAG: hypothetical protein QNI93_11730 [Kiloniellales bacterium]|nr:hypothetical protein [Kiloniellales bacterium]MDJ0981259.1 hypothetical protein [Kiloniellales bacterium]
MLVANQQLAVEDIELAQIGHDPARIALRLQFGQQFRDNPGEFRSRLLWRRFRRVAVSEMETAVGLPEHGDSSPDNSDAGRGQGARKQRGQTETDLDVRQRQDGPAFLVAHVHIEGSQVEVAFLLVPSQHGARDAHIDAAIGVGEASLQIGCQEIEGHGPAGQAPYQQADHDRRGGDDT